MSDSSRQVHGKAQLFHDRAQIEELSERILSAAESMGYSKASRFAIRLALEEAVMNAFHHGHAELPDEPVEVEFEVTPEAVELAVEDQGPGFTPEEVPDPTLDENLELPTGRGLMLIRTYMSETRYVGRGNRLEMVYRRPGS